MNKEEIKLWIRDCESAFVSAMKLINPDQDIEVTAQMSSHAMAHIKPFIDAFDTVGNDVVEINDEALTKGMKETHQRICNFQNCHAAAMLGVKDYKDPYNKVENMPEEKETKAEEVPETKESCFCSKVCADAHEALLKLHDADKPFYKQLWFVWTVAFWAGIVGFITGVIYGSE